MKTQYQYIKFIESTKQDGKTKVWVCYNNKSGDALGWVEYHQPWKQYVFSALNDDVIFSVSCLQDIIHFIGQLK